MKRQVVAGMFFCCLGLLCLGHMGKLLEVPNSWFLMFIAASAAASYLSLGVLLLADAVRQGQEEKQKAEYIKRITIMPRVKK